MGTSPTDVLKYLWVLTSTASNVEPRADDMFLDEESTASNVKLRAGGLCVHEEGLIVTVTHAIKPLCNKFQDFPSLTAQAHTGPPRKLDWIQDTGYKKFGLSLLKIRDPDVNEKFEAFPILEDDLSVDAKTRLRAFVIGDGHPFSFLAPEVYYPFKGVLAIPENEFLPLTFTSTPLHHETRTITTMTTNKVCKRAILTSYNDNLSSVIGTGVLDSCKALNPTMPLVQVCGLPITILDGQCGWPVFTEDNRMVGLIALSFGVDHQYLIPSKIVGRVVHAYLQQMGHAIATSTATDKGKEKLEEKDHYIIGHKRSRSSD